MSAARSTAVLSLLALTACALPRPTPQTDGSLTPAQLVAAVQSASDRIDHSEDPSERTRLLAAATANARQCVVVAPENGACHYAQAQVLGLTARERPVQAPSDLKQMLASLGRAEALDPKFDHAGPARLSAVVLLRAPGWPLGPGDADAAVMAAQRAVAADPGYPPNLITLAQAQAKTEANAPARATFERARQAVQAWAGVEAEAPAAVAAERAEWQHDIEQGLHSLQ